MNLTAIAAAVSAACGFGLAWQLQAHQIIKLELTHANARITQQRAARAALERATSAVIAAQSKAATRNAVLRADAVRAGDAGNGLRITSETTVRASADDLNACTAALSAHSVVLSAVIREAERLAEIADTWASQALILQDAWPKENFTESGAVK